MPKVRIHDLRHSAASLLVSMDVPLPIIAQRLGHSSTKMTGDTYSHASVQMQRPAIDALDKLLRQRQA